jgi:glycine cleavage system H protein
MMVEQNVPKELRYSKDHEWVRLEGDTAIVGITDHAQQALGDVTYVDLPRVGKAVKQFDELAAVESAKAASDVFSPVAGTVSEVNSELESAPEKVNADPYGEGWICKLTGVAAADLGALMDAGAYAALLESEST